MDNNQLLISNRMISEKKKYNGRYPTTENVINIILIINIHIYFFIQSEQLLLNKNSFNTINITKKNSKRIKSGNIFSKNPSKILPQKTSILKSKNDDKNRFNLQNNNNKKDYSNNLLKKCQIRYNSFLKEHRDVTMSGTKRFEDKSGEYYLQNMNKFNKNNLNINQKSVTSLKLNNCNNNNDNINYNSNKHMIKVKRKKILDELIPIPTLKQKNKLKNDFEKKTLYNAMGNAKYLRRYQYSNNITQKQLKIYKIYKENQRNEKINNDKVKFIQIWWKTIFQIIKIQKTIRGYLYRIKLISSLDQREEYIDKVIFLVKSVKKIFLYRLLNELVIYKPGNGYYFHKWKEITSKKVILKKMVNIAIINKNKNNFYLTTRFNSNILKKENDDSDSENEFYKMRKEIMKNENANKSLIDVYTKGIKNKKVKKGKHLSSSSFVLRTTKKNIKIGIELSTSQIINRTKKSLYDLNQTNCNKKGKKNTNNKIISTFDSVKKTVHKRNKSNNNQPKLNQYKFNTNNKYNIKENGLKEKSLNDLKNIKVNHNKNNFNNSNNKNMTLTKINTDLTKSSNFGKNLTNTESKDDISKKSINKKKMHNYAVSNISNHSTNLFNTSNKNKKIKVYENKLNDYNNKITNNENNSENQLFSIDKENQQLDKLLPYAESIFDESQFSAFLDNSTLINNKNIYNYSQDNDRFIFNNNKSSKNNSCFDVLSIRNQEKTNNFEALVILKNYFDIWAKKTIFGLLLRKVFAIKNIFIGGNALIHIISYKYYKLFFEKFKDGYSFLILKEYFNLWILKLFTERIKSFGEKFKLMKYFKFYKMIIDKKMILQNVIQYEKYIIRKNKGRKKRNREQFYTEYEQDNKYYITDFPISNIINNRYSLNNNTNNCYIINNLNYNSTDNKINIGLSYQNDLTINNNNNNSNGTIRSKVIEFPKHIYNQNKIKQSIYDKSNNSNIIFTDNINNHKTIDNSNLFNFNTDNKIKNNIMKNIDTNDNCLQNNLNRSVIISNKPSHFEPDLTTQKNQLMMVINIIERHRKSNNHNLFLSCFQEWKNTMNYDPNQNIKLRNKKIIKNQTSFNTNKNDKIINFSCGTIDNEELTKNTINSEGFPTESDSKSENKISNISNNKLNSKLNSDKNKYSSSSTFDFQEKEKEKENKNDNNPAKKCFQGVYKKKTIPGSTNKSMSFVKKNSFNHSLNSNTFQLSRITDFPNDLQIQESIKEDNENDNVIKTISHKNLNLKDEANMNIVNFGYSTPEDYFGFKKVNKIEEMEVSFVPLNEKNINSNNDDDNDKYNENDHEINTEKEDEYNKEDKKEVIIEAIEEYNEFEGDNEKIIQKIKNEFNNYEEKLFYKTIDYFKTNFDNEINKENEKENNNKSMINIT